MPRTKPTNKLDVIGNLDLKPEDAVGDYIESKEQEKYFIKPPYWDIPGDSLELLAIKNEREYVEMQNLQTELLQRAKRQRAVNDKRIDDMYKVQNDLKDRFIAVNNFIRDCEEKEHIAVKKIVQEKKIQEQLKTDISRYRKDIEDLEQFRDVLSQTVKDMEPYETVIEEVVQKSDILKSVKDCMDRCDALMLAQVEISELEQEKIKAIEEVRRNMVKATNDAALTVLGLNNELAELERSYNHARAESFKWEKIIAETKDYIVGNELTKERILDGLQHMHKLLCRRKGIETRVRRDNIEAHFDFLKNEIQILDSLANICKKEFKDTQRDTI